MPPTQMITRGIALRLASVQLYTIPDPQSSPASTNCSGSGSTTSKILPGMRGGDRGLPPFEQKPLLTTTEASSQVLPLETSFSVAEAYTQQQKASILAQQVAAEAFTPFLQQIDNPVQQMSANPSLTPAAAWAVFSIRQTAISVSSALASGTLKPPLSFHLDGSVPQSDITASLDTNTQQLHNRRPSTTRLKMLKNRLDCISGLERE